MRSHKARPDVNRESNQARNRSEIPRVIAQYCSEAGYSCTFKKPLIAVATPDELVHTVGSP
jgi:hypothetical protein